MSGVICAAAMADSSSAPRLSLPIACELGKTCFIQSYVDVDQGPGIRDYACGSATYDTHNGTDFRLVSAEQARVGVDVLAAADGTVKAVRDGMADSFTGEAAEAGLKGRECGNGVVIDHGNGWETQYCHMRQGSLAVKSGDHVARGGRVGFVGYSGLAEFAHLHLTVRNNRKVIDPFSGRDQYGVCSSETGGAKGLWDEAAASAMPYAGGQVFAAGFTAAAPALEELERSHLGRNPDARSEQLIFFARLLNLRAGDRIQLAIKGPAGFEIKSLTSPLARNKATYVAYAGKRRTLPSWPTGKYEGVAQMLRGDVVISEMRTSFSLPD